MQRRGGLLVLDIDGTLIAGLREDLWKYSPQMKVMRRAYRDDLDVRVFQYVNGEPYYCIARPGLDAFLRFAFEHFEAVALWTNASSAWLTSVMQVVHPPPGHDWLFTWSQVDFNLAPFTASSHAPISVADKMWMNWVKFNAKDLRWVWREFPQFGRHNTWLVDDNPSVAVHTPGNILPVPEFTVQSVNDIVLPLLAHAISRGHDLGSTWLHDLASRVASPDPRRIPGAMAVIPDSALFVYVATPYKMKAPSAVHARVFPALRDLTGSRPKGSFLVPRHGAQEFVRVLASIFPDGGVGVWLRQTPADKSDGVRAAFPDVAWCGPALPSAPGTVYYFGHPLHAPAGAVVVPVDDFDDPLNYFKDAQLSLLTAFLRRHHHHGRHRYWGRGVLRLLPGLERP